jgi:hypothetical protein
MPRPPKEPKTKEPKSKRTRRWIVRVSDADDQAARANAKRAGLSFSAYLRRMGADGKIAPPDPLVPLVAALNRAGNNVNQQMAIAHVRGALPPLLLRLDALLEHAVRAVMEKLSPIG